MPELHKAGGAFLVAIAHFYVQSEGFTKHYNEMYAYWKCIPMLILISFVVLHGGGVPLKTRAFLSFALTCGTAGDYIIGLSKEGIIPGAIAFGLGHIFYMITIVPDGVRGISGLLWPMVLILVSGGVALFKYCFLPMMSVSVPAVILLSTYSFILGICIVITASQCYLGTDVHPPGAPGLKWRLLAYTLFYISDNTLIFNECGYTIPYAEKIILATYYGAQYLLIRAAVSSEKHRPGKKVKAG